MSIHSTGSPEFTELVDLPSLNLNFPLPPPIEIPRDSLVSTVDGLINDRVYAVAIEGPDGLGKTTFLSQFARRHPDTAISLFFSSANRLSYDVDLVRSHLAIQVCWACTGKVLQQGHYDFGLLKSYYTELQQKAKRKKLLFYFIVDGSEELSPHERRDLWDQLAPLLPIGIQQFRFLFSGDEALYRPYIDSRLAMKSFELTRFGTEETKALFSAHNISTELAADLTNTCGGIPGKLAEVLRVVDRETSPQDILKDIVTNCPEVFALDWRQVEQADYQLKMILAYLAYDLKPHALNDITETLQIPESIVREELQTVNFIRVDKDTTDVRFVSTGLQRYVAKRLKDLESNIRRLSIKKLLREQDNPDSFLLLPQYYEEAAQHSDLLTHLTPEHILRVLHVTQTLSGVHTAVRRGLQSAKQLEREPDILRFGIQKSIVSELSSQYPWRSEVAALVALRRDAEARALANGALFKGL